jgi:hypothetical protein
VERVFSFLGAVELDVKQSILYKRFGSLVESIAFVPIFSFAIVEVLGHPSGSIRRVDEITKWLGTVRP